MAEKGINTQVVEAKSKLVTVINEMNLPISIIHLIMQEVLGYINSEVATALEKERNEAARGD